MTPLENEITALKKELINMWILVQSQLNKAKEAMVQFDKDLAREVLVKEKRVNSFELKIDREMLVRTKVINNSAAACAVDHVCVEPANAFSSKGADPRHGLTAQ